LRETTPHGLKPLDLHAQAANNGGQTAADRAGASAPPLPADKRLRPFRLEGAQPRLASILANQAITDDPRRSDLAPTFGGPRAGAVKSESPLGPGEEGTTSQGHPRTIFKRALEHDNLVLAEVTAREIGRVTIAEALELTALVARKQPDRYGRFAARWLYLWLEEHEKATLEDVVVLVSNLRSLASSKDQGSALATLRKAARQG